MIKIRLTELLEERGKTLYWLATKTKVRYASIWQMSRNDVKTLNLKTLDKICTVLDVEPGEILQQIHKRKRG